MKIRSKSRIPKYSQEYENKENKNKENFFPRSNKSSNKVVFGAFISTGTITDADKRSLKKLYNPKHNKRSDPHFPRHLRTNSSIQPMNNFIKKVEREFACLNFNTFTSDPPNEESKTSLTKVSVVTESPKIQTQFRNFLEAENSNIIKDYGNASFSNLKKREKIEVFPNLLKKHKIDNIVRAKMVDWMVEIFYIYESIAETFFLAVYIMDKFIYSTSSILTNNDIHLLGITCVFLASKFEDIYPLQMNKIETLYSDKFSR